ncbi:restriction endonuclease subunit S [Helicobacter mesocricetorum]|uniref:restriction endonuclease subunit S n=1 Tax=Helicobacter mesocricetorum TaxID=87012 RepID=UPI000CF1345A|nr:restriction endonuclease subunit S [Helicobacter mesocricetorum]
MEIAKNELGLESIKWGEFKLSLFFKNYHGKRLIERDREQGKTPLLTAGEADNGVASFIGNESMQKYKDFISIDMFGNAFYHSYEATGDDNIYFFINEKLSFYVKLFFVSCINKQKSKFSYGKQFRQHNADSLKILLPLDSKGEPNYKFMESFMKELEQKHLQKILAYYTHKLELSGGGAISFNYQEYLEFIETLTPCQTKPLSKISQNNSISTKADDDKDLAFPYMSLTYICKDYKLQWGEFKISDLFEVYTGGDLILTNIIEGEIPIVSHSAIDNGVSVYTQTIPNRKKFNHKTTISLADRGNFFAATQKIDFYIGTRVKALEAKFTQVNYFILLFICLCINKQSVKFSYGKNCCANADSLKILLPLDSKGQPNYAFMESFMKELEQKHLQKILAYYTHKLESIRE